MRCAGFSYPLLRVSACGFAAGGMRVFFGGLVFERRSVVMKQKKEKVTFRKVSILVPSRVLAGLDDVSARQARSRSQTISIILAASLRLGRNLPPPVSRGVVLLAFFVGSF